MVTVVDFAVKQNSEGEEFIALQLKGSLVMVLSHETKKYYTTAQRCAVSSTLQRMKLKIVALRVE